MVSSRIILGEADVTLGVAVAPALTSGTCGTAASPGNAKDAPTIQLRRIFSVAISPHGN